MDSFALGGFSQGINEGLKSVQQGVMQAEQLKQAQVQRETQEEQLKTLKMQNEQLQKDMAKQQTFEALDLYANSGDTTKVNYLLKNNSLVSQAFGGNIARIDAINDYDMEHFSLDPSKMQVGRYAKLTKKDGTQTLVDMDQIYATTGYFNYASNKQKELLQNRATIAESKAKESSSKVLEAGAYDLLNKVIKGEISGSEAADILSKWGKTGQVSFARQDSEEMAKIEQKIKNGTATDFDISLYDNYMALHAGVQGAFGKQTRALEATLNRDNNFNLLDPNFDVDKFKQENPDSIQTVEALKRNLATSETAKYIDKSMNEMNKEGIVSSLAQVGSSLVTNLKENKNLDTNIVSKWLNDVKGYIGLNVRDIPKDEKQRIQMFTDFNQLIALFKKAEAGATLSNNENTLLADSITNLKKNKFVNLSNIISKLDQNIAKMSGIADNDRKYFNLSGYNRKLNSLQQLRDDMNELINPEDPRKYETLKQQQTAQQINTSTSNTVNQVNAVDTKNMTTEQKLKAMDSIAGGGL